MFGKRSSVGNMKNESPKGAQTPKDNNNNKSFLSSGSGSSKSAMPMAAAALPPLSPAPNVDRTQWGPILIVS